MFTKNQKGVSNVVFIITITIFAFIIVGGVAWYLLDQNNNTKTTNTNTVETTDKTENSEEHQTQINETVAVLANVKDGKGIGSATKSKIDGKYKLVVTTEELPDPSEGYVYNTWIEKKLPFNRINVGELIKQEDGIYTLEFSSATDYSLFRTIYITLEKENKEERDEYPGEKVLNGLFTL